MQTLPQRAGRGLSAIFAATVAMLVIGGLSSPAAADQIPAGWAAKNMMPVGYSDLDGHGGAFKIAIKQVNGRWYLYLGHLWNHGWSIVDVTDPANPKYLEFIPGPENTWTIQMELHDNIMLTALQKSSAIWQRSQ